SDRTITIQQYTGYVFSLVDFPIADPSDSPANMLLAVKITTLPTAAILENRGTPVVAGQFISAADIAAGNLEYQPYAPGSGSVNSGVLSDSFTFQVQDDGGAANGGVDLDQTPNTISFAFAPPPPPPEGFDATVTTLENQAYVFSYFDLFGAI